MSIIQTFPSGGGSKKGGGAIKAYYNSTDGKFYKESTYATEITPDADSLYLDLSTENLYDCDGSVYTKINPISSSTITTALGYTPYNSASAGTAAAKDYTSSVTQSSTDLVTSGAVWTAIDNLPEPMVFKGTLGTGGTITDLPAAAAANHGDTYKVITAGTYASIVAKVGDVFTSDGNSWVLIPAGDTDSDTWRAIKVNGTEKLGSAISTGAVDFVNGTNTTVSFDATGGKISVSADLSSRLALAGGTMTGDITFNTSKGLVFTRPDSSGHHTTLVPGQGSEYNPDTGEITYDTTDHTLYLPPEDGFLATVNDIKASDWNQTNQYAKDFIKNKPTKVSDFTNDSGFVTTDAYITCDSVKPSSETGYYPTLVPAASWSSNQKPKINSYFKIYLKNGTTSVDGYNYLILGNDIASGTADNQYGVLRLYAKTAYRADLYATSNLTANRNIGLPDKDGTIALTSDLSSYLPLAGGTMTGTLKSTENAVGINFRPSNNDYSTTTSYQTTGNEALVFATKNAVTSFMFVNGEDSVTNHASDRWQSLTPGLQIKNNKVAIGKLIANGTNLTYPLEVNGDIQATNFRGALIGNVTGNVSGSSGSCTGNAATATKATKDGDGNVISSTYVKNGIITLPINPTAAQISAFPNGTMYIVSN